MRAPYHGKRDALIFMEFFIMTLEAIILFFSRRGLILLLQGFHQGEFHTIISIGTLLA
jgi:hypothetical protein